MAQIIDIDFKTLAAKFLQDDEGKRKLIDEGEQAAERIAKSTIHDWIAVGEALVEMELAALHISKSNNPKGKAYNAAYAAWAEHFPLLAKIDPATRSQAKWMARNKEQVLSKYEDLDPKEQQKFNHPSTIKRRMEGKPSTKKASQTQQQANLELQRENDELIQRVSYLENEINEGGVGIINGPQALAEHIDENLSDEELTELISLLQAIAGRRGLKNKSKKRLLLSEEQVLV